MAMSVPGLIDRYDKQAFDIKLVLLIETLSSGIKNMQSLLKLFSVLTLFVLIAFTYNGGQYSVNAKSLQPKMAEFANRMRHNNAFPYSEEEPEAPHARKRRETPPDQTRVCNFLCYYDFMKSYVLNYYLFQGASQDAPGQKKQHSSGDHDTRRQAPSEKPPTKFNGRMNAEPKAEQARVKRQMPSPPSPPEGMPMPPM
uniref:Uncharacterized protein n=1 Tax=Glossina brevipalpis TaxID=37001 RepID=A0A1A9X2I4_9MUSC